MYKLIVIACLLTGGVSHCDYRVANGVFPSQSQCSTGAALIAGMSERTLVRTVETSFAKQHGYRAHLPYDAYEFGYTYKCTRNGTEQPWITQGSAHAMKDFANTE